MAQCAQRLEREFCRDVEEYGVERGNCKGRKSVS